MRSAALSLLLSLAALAPVAAQDADPAARAETTVPAPWGRVAASALERNSRGVLEGATLGLSVLHVRESRLRRPLDPIYLEHAKQPPREPALRCNLPEPAAWRVVQAPPAHPVGKAPAKQWRADGSHDAPQ